MKGQDLIDKLYAQMTKPVEAVAASTNGSGLVRGRNRGDGAVGDVPKDEQVIERCRGAKNAPKFEDLFDRGDVDLHHGGDESVADLGLLGLLAFYTQDETQLERLFSASALGRRSKWQTRSDYRRRTIARALRDLGEVYDWNKNGGTAALPIRRSAASAANDVLTVEGALEALRNGNAPRKALENYRIGTQDFNSVVRSVLHFWHKDSERWKEAAPSVLAALTRLEEDD